METVTDFILGEAPKSLKMVTAAMKLKVTCTFGRKAVTNLDSTLKNRGITLPTKVCLVKATQPRDWASVSYVSCIGKKVPYH